MRSLTYALLALLAGGGMAAEPVYLDQLMEMPLSTLERSFPGLKKEGCYRVAPDRYLVISIEKKDQKPWRIVYTSLPCRRAEEGAQIDVRQRKGVELGYKTMQLLETMGRPDTAVEPDGELKRFGDTEYFYICRVSEGCARHTSVFVQNGLVSAIAEWYSE